MNYSRAIFIATLLLISFSVLGQSKDSDRKSIEGALYRALMDNASPSECASTDISFSMVCISFDRKGCVDKVDASAFPACLDFSKFKAVVKDKFAALDLNRKHYRNQYILFPLLYSAKEKSWSADELGKKWETDFSAMNTFETGHRELKMVIPLIIQIYPRIIN